MIWKECGYKFPEDWTTSVIRIKKSKKLITEPDVKCATPEYFIMEDDNSVYYKDCEFLDEQASADGWVAIASGKLPEANQKVFLYDDGILLTFFRFCPRGFNGNPVDMFVDMNNKGPIELSEVTHWRPIIEGPSSQPLPAFPDSKPLIDLLNEWQQLDMRVHNALDVGRLHLKTKEALKNYKP